MQKTGTMYTSSSTNSLPSTSPPSIASNPSVCSSSLDIISSTLSSDELKGSNSKLSSLEIQQLLWPHPQCLTHHDGPPLVLPEELSVQLLPPSGLSTTGNISTLMNVWKGHKESLADLGYKLDFHYLSTAGSPLVICGVNRDVFQKEESYNLTVLSENIHLSASDVIALNHGIRTLIQIIVIFREHPGLPLVQIKDWPSLSHRALKINITAKSSMVPKMESLRIAVQTWSKLKLNQIHLHCDLHTSARWQIPYSPMEMLEFENLCNEHGISLVPSLDFESDFVKEISEVLAVIKAFLQGFTTTRYIALGETLLGALMSVGGDFVDHLPLDLSRVTLMLPASFMMNTTCAIKLQSVEVTSISEVDASSKQSKMYSQCLLINPVNYSSMCHFDQEKISDICTWIQKAVDENNIGIIVSPSTECNWTMPVAYVAPILLSLGLAWNHKSHESVAEKISRYLNHHLLCDKGGSLGQVLLDLGSAEAHAPLLWRLLSDTDSVDIEKCTGNMFQRVVRQLLSCQTQLHKVDLSYPNSGQVLAEVQLLTDLLIFAARIGKHLVSVGTNPNSSYGISVINVGIANLPPTAKTDLANKLLGLIEQFRAIWLSAYLPNNVQTSLLKLNNLLNLLFPTDSVDNIPIN